MYMKLSVALLAVVAGLYGVLTVMDYGQEQVAIASITPEVQNIADVPDNDIPKPMDSIERFNPATDPEVILPSEPTSAGVSSEIELAVPAPDDLNNSGLLFNQTIDSLAPSLTKWLLPDEQVRKWVLTIDKLAEGSIPKRYRPVEFSIESFKASPEKADLVISDTNYNRIKPFLDGIMSISPQTMSRYYLAWRPVLEEAYSELGKSGSFHAQLNKAMDNILAAPDAPTFATLTRPHALYQYKDRSYEDASDLEKLLWRLGPNNMHELQDYLKEVKLYL